MAKVTRGLSIIHGVCKVSPMMLLTSFFWTFDQTVKIRWIHTCAQKVQCQLKMVPWRLALCNDGSGGSGDRVELGGGGGGGEAVLEFHTSNEQ